MVEFLIEDLEEFFENPNGDGVSYPNGNLDGFSQMSAKLDGNQWVESPSYRLVAGHIDLVPEEDKARFWLVLARRNGGVVSYVLTGLLAKNDEGGLSCSVLFEEWQRVMPVHYRLRHLSKEYNWFYIAMSAYRRAEIEALKPATSFAEHVKSEILYLDPPGNFDCEALERDALTLKVLTAKLLIHEGEESESYAEECATQAGRLAEELRQDCHKRMENFATAQESGAKPKRTIQEELSYLKDIDTWQKAVAKIARTQHNFPNIDIDLFPPLSDTTFGFLNDSSLIKRRMQLEPRVGEYVNETFHPLNF